MNGSKHGFHSSVALLVVSCFPILLSELIIACILCILLKRCCPALDLLYSLGFNCAIILLLTLSSISKRLKDIGKYCSRTYVFELIDVDLFCLSCHDNILFMCGTTFMLFIHGLI